MEKKQAGSELFRVLEAKCIKCGLKKRMASCPTHGMPRQGVVFDGVSFFGAGCLRCGCSKFESLTPGLEPELPEPPQGWVKQPGVP